MTIAHSRTKNIEELVKSADILVAAVGIPEMVKGNWVKKGAVVIDVGINRIDRDGKKILVGDVDYNECIEKFIKNNTCAWWRWTNDNCLSVIKYFVHLL